MKNTVEFVIDVVGDATKNSYVGKFVAKTKLSVRETLRQDEIRRGILGVDSQNAGEDVQRIAWAVAYLTVRIEKAPDWWKELDGGMKAEDMNLLAEVCNKCQDAIEAERKEFNKEADVAKNTLQDLKDKDKQ